MQGKGREQMAGFNLTATFEQTLGTNATTSEILASIILIRHRCSNRLGNLFCF